MVSNNNKTKAQYREDCNGMEQHAKDWQKLQDIDLQALFVGKTLWRGRTRLIVIQDAVIVPNHDYLVLLLGYKMRNGRCEDAHLLIGKTQAEYINYQSKFSDGAFSWGVTGYELRKN